MDSEPSDVSGIDLDERLRSYLRGVPTRGRMTDTVVEILREAILDGALPSGAWLPEDRLATALAVSRTPVREALRLLADDGLVAKTVHYGAVVAPWSLDDVLALYVVRAQLEGLASRLAAQRLPAGLLPTLMETNGRMAACLESGNLSNLASINLEFHKALRDAAENPYLSRFLIQIEHAVRRADHSTLERPDRAAAVIAEHQAIIDAVGRQDPDAAEAAAKHHMHNARNARITGL
jgi:DNA-binding GntR family transcriptional regulator